MAENRKQLLHVRSSVEGKLPTAEQIEHGEIAINFFDGNEKLSIKSSTGNIRTFSTDEQNNTKFETKERVAEIDEVVSKTFDTMNNSCGFNENVQYVPQNELIQGCTSLSEAIEIVAEKANSGGSSINIVQVTGSSETDVMSQKAVSDELTRIDTVTSASFDNYFKACGFKDGEVKYSSEVAPIANAGSIINALEVLATTTAQKNDVENAIEFSKYLYSVNFVDTINNLPIDKYLVIAEINSSTNSDSLTLSNTLAAMQEISIIIHNASTSPLTIALPSSSSTYVNMSGSNFVIPANEYAEINILSDGTKNYIRFA